MEVFVFGTYHQLSEKAADDLIGIMKRRKDPFLCVASGDSPDGLYKNVVTKVQKNELDVTGWHFIGLDEWTGMNANDEGSCRYHLDHQFFTPLQTRKEKIFFFDGRKEGLKKECEDAESFIIQHGGIEAAILGLGLNGHIGMNEPGTSAASNSHIVQLDTVTAQTAQKYFKEKRSVTDGITLGIATIMRSKFVMLIVNGAHKAAIVKAMLEGDISEQIPASLLRKHPALKIYLDAGAASLLSPATKAVYFK